MKLTIYEVAKKAGVSIATVSRALNAETRRKVAQDTLKRVDEVIRRHQYAPNLAARGLTQSVFHTVGVVVPHGEGFFLNEYYSTILCGVADSLLETKYRFKLLMLKCAERKWDRYNFRTAEGVDALIITHWHALFRDKNVFKRLDIPAVMVGDPEKNVNAHFVSADQYLGGRLAAEYLYGKGHRRFAVMTGSPFSIDSRLRLRGFSNFLRSKRCPIKKRNILCGEFQEKPAEAAAEAFFKRGADATAMFCVNDTMAYGVIRKMGDIGIRCPEDLSVMGFDDDSRAAHSRPALSTVRVPLYAIAREATKRLVDFLGGAVKRKDFLNKRTLFPAEVVQRESVRKV